MEYIITGKLTQDIHFSLKVHCTGDEWGHIATPDTQGNILVRIEPKAHIADLTVGDSTNTFIVESDMDITPMIDEMIKENI